MTMLLLNEIVKNVEYFCAISMPRMDYDIKCVRESIKYLGYLELDSPMKALNLICELQLSIDLHPHDRKQIDFAGEVLSRAVWLRSNVNASTLEETLEKLKCIGGPHNDEY